MKEKGRSWSLGEKDWLRPLPPSPFGQGSIDWCSTHTPAASFFFFGRIYARRAWYKAVTNVDNTRAIVRVLNQSPSHSLSVRTFGQALIKGKPTKSLKWNKNRLSEKDWLRPLLPSPFGRGSIVSFMTGLFSSHYTYVLYNTCCCFFAAFGRNLIEFSSLSL